MTYVNAATFQQQPIVAKRDEFKPVPKQTKPPTDAEIESQIENKPGVPITNRDDFKSNWAGDLLVKKHANYSGHGKLTDLYRYLAGQPLQHTILSISNVKPVNSKDPDARYVSIDDPGFKQQVLDNYQRVSTGGLVTSPMPGLSDDYTNEQKTGKNTYNISAYNQIGGSALGHYTVSRGSDEKGDYISYYDNFNTSTGASGLGVLKPFEVYGRVRFDPKTNKYIPDDKISQPISPQISAASVVSSGGGTVK